MISTHQRLNVKHASENVAYKLPKECFAHWLVGVTDGDGCFSFSVDKKKNSIWNCTFKIGQTTSNYRLLYFIKENLGFGKINSKSGKNMAEFRIRERKTLLNLIVPLFTKFPLYSTKQFYFLQWVKALETLENKKLASAEKNEILTRLKSQTPEMWARAQGEDIYLSPSWQEGDPTSEWISGFVEAEGSFFLTIKANRSNKVREETPRTLEKQDDLPLQRRVVHAFGITQKLDGVILEFLRKRFHIASKALHTKRCSLREQRDVYKLETTNSRSIAKIRDFFLNKLKGIKSLEYKIWSRSLKFKGNSEKLFRVQNQLRELRNSKKVPKTP